MRTERTVQATIGKQMSAPLTADTITDEQIRELRATLPDEPEYGGFEWQRARECAWALSPNGHLGAFERDRIATARARCAEILNQRASKEDK